eukprot:tig00000670_g3012.t1
MTGDCTCVATRNEKYDRPINHAELLSGPRAVPALALQKLHNRMKHYQREDFKITQALESAQRRKEKEEATRAARESERQWRRGSFRGLESEVQQELLATATRRQSLQQSIQESARSLQEQRAAAARAQRGELDEAQAKVAEGAQLSTRSLRGSAAAAAATQRAAISSRQEALAEERRRAGEAGRAESARNEASVESYERAMAAAKTKSRAFQQQLTRAAAYTRREATEVLEEHRREAAQKEAAAQQRAREAQADDVAAVGLELAAAREALQAHTAEFREAQRDAARLHARRLKLGY